LIVISSFFLGYSKDTWNVEISSYGLFSIKYQDKRQEK